MNSPHNQVLHFKSVRRVAMHDGLVHLELVSDGGLGGNGNSPGVTELVVPLTGFVRFAHAVNKVLDDFEQNGIIQRGTSAEPDFMNAPTPGPGPVTPAAASAAGAGTAGATAAQPEPKRKKGWVRRG